MISNKIRFLTQHILKQHKINQHHLNQLTNLKIMMWNLTYSVMICYNRSSLGQSPRMTSAIRIGKVIATRLSAATAQREIGSKCTRSTKKNKSRTRLCKCKLRIFTLQNRSVKDHMAESSQRRGRTNCMPLRSCRKNLS